MFRAGMARNRKWGLLAGQWNMVWSMDTGGFWGGQGVGVNQGKPQEPLRGAASRGGRS